MESYQLVNCHLVESNCFRLFSAPLYFTYFFAWSFYFLLKTLATYLILNICLLFKKHNEQTQRANTTSKHSMSQSMNISQRISEDKLNLANFQVKDYQIQLKEAREDIEELHKQLKRFRLAQRTASIRIMKETQDLKNERTELQNDNHTMVAIIADKDYELNSLRKVISDMSENLP
jgi:hypothetical protein